MWPKWPSSCRCAPVSFQPPLGGPFTAQALIASPCHRQVASSPFSSMVAACWALCSAVGKSID
jgi:hypothetical protein